MTRVDMGTSKKSSDCLDSQFDEERAKCQEELFKRLRECPNGERSTSDSLGEALALLLNVA
jgi:hypothetical protein